MFRTNETHRQQSIFGSEQLLPSTYQERLRNSWSHAFRKEVFERIDEHIFAVLFSDEERGIIERVLSEHFSVAVVDEKEVLRVRWDTEIWADSLQSPHDA